MSRQAPNLDRRATLGVASQGSRNRRGEWQSGMVTEHVIWLALRDWDIGMDVAPEGVRQTGELDFITRYRADVMSEAFGGDINPVTGHAFLGWFLVIDSVRWKITDAEELPQYGRRRFMKIKGARNT